MAELYDQTQEERYEEDRRGLPSSFTTVRAAGSLTTRSSSDRYNPSPERWAAFAAERASIDEANRQEMIDSAGYILD